MPPGLHGCVRRQRSRETFENENAGAGFEKHTCAGALYLMKYLARHSRQPKKAFAQSSWRGGADIQMIRCATGPPRPRSQRSEVRSQQENDLHLLLRNDNKNCVFYVRF